jgi:dienelactone hydrolase
MVTASIPVRKVEIGRSRLKGLIGIPPAARGLVIFAHGSGSGRLSPRNSYVARALMQRGFATLLVDLLTPLEERDRANVFDIELLAERLAEATEWAAAEPATATLPIGYFGASTGGGAALAAAARADGRVAAIVSRGGRPDLAGDALPLVRAPTLLVVGGDDHEVIRLNEAAARRMACRHELVIVRGAGHLFEEPGTLDAVIEHAARWFAAFMPER